MSYKEEQLESNKAGKNLTEAMPELMSAFRKVHAEYAKKSATTLKEKEMVSIGIAIVLHCVPCLLAHIPVFKKAGGTREELLDVIKAAVLMHGGPGTAYGAKALAIFDELD